MENDELIKEARKYVGKFSLTEDDLTAGSVASALVTPSGKIYVGICLDLACGVGFCAEHSAVAAMLLDRETVISKVVAVSAKRILPPCGRCRELMVQIDRRNYECVVILPDGKTALLKDLLPSPWQKAASVGEVNHSHPGA